MLRTSNSENDIVERIQRGRMDNSHGRVLVGGRIEGNPCRPPKGTLHSQNSEVAKVL